MRSGDAGNEASGLSRDHAFKLQLRQMMGNYIGGDLGGFADQMFGHRVRCEACQDCGSDIGAGNGRLDHRGYFFLALGRIGVWECGENVIRAAH
jgi:hypothetical protein